MFLEKPIALDLAETDELVALARRNRLKFTIGHSQRFNLKFAYVRKSIRDGTIGRPVSALVSRHITRNLGTTKACRGSEERNRNRSWVAIHNVAAAEAMVLGINAGLDPAAA